MSKKQWPVAAAMLLMLLHTGCSGTGRFNRQQYAELEADPFLTADADLERSSDGARKNRPAGAIAGKVHDTSKSTNDASSSLEASRERNSVSSTPVTSAIRHDGKSLTQSSPAQHAVDAGSGFDAWLEKQGDQLVQASGQLHEDVRASGLSARQKIQQADYSVFPNEQQSVGIQDPVTAENRVKKNSFGESDAAAADSTKSTGDKVSWPPKNFEFP